MSGGEPGEVVFYETTLQSFSNYLPYEGSGVVCTVLTLRTPTVHVHLNSFFFPEETNPRPRLVGSLTY